MTTADAAPLIVQNDFSILVDTHAADYETVLPLVSQFADLVRSPDHIHFYQLSPLSLWNAAAAGVTLDTIMDVLSRYSRATLPPTVVAGIADYMRRYGALQIVHDGDHLLLRSEDDGLLGWIAGHARVRGLLGGRDDDGNLVVDHGNRGALKQALVELGYPPHDVAGYASGAPLDLALRPTTARGEPWSLRPYQIEAIDAFYQRGAARGGSGVIVLPCGAGKTVVGIGTIAAARTHTLILCPNTVALRQWIAELLDKTTVARPDIGEYSSERKEIKPITLATYQMLTYRPFTVDQATGEVGDFPHLSLLKQANWGLLIYDEVHLLPAPVFRATAELQARRRLGLTATLVREDGRERDVFSLIGPKKYELPWRTLEQEGFIAEARCTEVRVDMDADRRMRAALSETRQDAYRIAAENPYKIEVVLALVRLHRHDHVLVIGQYLDQLEAIAKHLNAPMLSGKTPTHERERLYAAFRRGDERVLIVSKIANFAIDLPDADVAIQVSGTFGSRQEEAQRLGRILRPKRDGRAARFYTVVTRDSRDQDFAAKRQIFLAEQGYRYEIVDALDVL
jgi:DNA excision repair protein ERCC-3